MAAISANEMKLRRVYFNGTTFREEGETCCLMDMSSGEDGMKATIAMLSADVCVTSEKEGTRLVVVLLLCPPCDVRHYNLLSITPT